MSRIRAAQSLMAADKAALVRQLKDGQRAAHFTIDDWIVALYGPAPERQPAVARNPYCSHSTLVGRSQFRHRLD